MSPVPACLWDTDTLAAERARFPEIDQLIAGNFPRHSKEFHEWRKARALDLIRKKQDVAGTHDDLAVSQHKLGDHQAAIETMLKKEKMLPGIYETYSNLGTFYIYTGELDLAAQYIRKALAIHANAHFGREKYQLWLVEWLQQRRAASDEDTEEKNGEIGLGVPRGFAEYIARRIHDLPPSQQINDLNLTIKEQAEALRGVWGMMWFADFDNPILLEALLIVGDRKTNAAQLAALSYLHASTVVTGEKEKARLLKLCQAASLYTQSLRKQDSEPKELVFNLDTLKQMLEKGLEKGKQYAEVVRQDELAWIQAGVDVGLEFQKKYLKP